MIMIVFVNAALMVFLSFYSFLLTIVSTIYILVVNSNRQCKKIYPFEITGQFLLSSVYALAFTNQNTV